MDARSAAMVFSAFSRNLIRLAVVLVLSAAPASATAAEYTVRSGDTLGAIALRHGVGIDALCRANRIGRTTPIRIGQTLTIPDAKPEKTTSQANAASSGQTYVVRSGDTLGGIALRFHVSARDLAAANGVGSKATIRVGQKLRIPGPNGKVGAREHEVASGDTLGKIAARYDVPIDDLAAANRMKRTDPIRIGQTLTIPGSNGETTSASRSEPDPEPAPTGGMQTLPVAGAPPAYYFEPTGPGRLSLRPVLMYLHGRGAAPAEYCRRWAQVVRRYGWLVCPQGPEDRGGGRRGWGNNWPLGRHIVKSALSALRSKYGRRVQLYGNTIIGFSEGAFVAMNVGIYEPRAFNRWLILGADTDYWTPKELEALHRNRGRIRRVYLITGEKDVVHDETEKVRGYLRRAGIPVRMSTPSDLGHKVALESKAAMYKAAISWLGG